MRSVRDGFHAWRAVLGRPIDASSLAVFRILFGQLMFWEVLRFVEKGRIADCCIEPTFHFTYPFFEFVKPWPGNGMYWHFGVMALAAFGVAIGLWYRLSAILLFLTYGHFFLIDKTHYNNHYYLILLLTLLLIGMQPHRWASLDALRARGRSTGQVPYWNLWLLRLQFCLVYFYAGVAKLNPDWLRGEPLRRWLPARANLPVIGPWLAHPQAPLLFSYGGLLFDLGIGWLLLWPRTRLVAVMASLAFHLTNTQLFSIGIFPLLMMASTVLFAEPDWARRIAGRARGWWPRRPASFRPPGDHSRLAAGRLASPVTALFVAAYLTIQILVPLRHWLYPGNVSWTEEGHRFAWHMKLRDKEGIVLVRVTDPRTGATAVVDLRRDLTPKQIEEMSARPDMIWQYARFVRRKLEARGMRDPVVTVSARASLNHRPFYPLIDPSVNLGAVEYPVWSPAPWILPLPEEQ